MLGHERNFFKPAFDFVSAPVWSCSDYSQGSLPSLQHRTNIEQRGELGQPCNAPMIRHAIGTDQIIDLDFICATLWAGFFFFAPRLTSPGCRYEEMEDGKSGKRGEIAVGVRD